MRKIQSSREICLREVAGEYMLLSTGTDFGNCLMMLNETGAFLWKQLKEPVSPEELLQICLDTFESDSEIIKQDLEEFLTRLADRKLIETVES